ncbi:phosphoglycerol transferase I [Erwinia sp. OLTSP20]|uniref:phosphatidylglycerol--membrane-oligosaccharide glycerophosphotransferase n=1 Tax=unclassified Erwinia TaxID=2622719 RepID=UPI000C177D19|nr:MULTISPECIES: phosphatidylglycerol--membrane-oligosaccharide glycerophosphotransferase [unclassified Erwinia]PIJ50133.1 phosphoglycerol transferase I [Erwinia sp. OAMSP11]PIJ71899.1 phosphoglycerol transferase I [Erwinia sp. OLSSP12]PIJ81101.1 phosphoglycerol transferase I [Erwinia sp. OLCASP19]PIJ83531.1 phosphoglycerol transferase I [Erwinia sp. OLMTSP26]PIJ86146.1 phosphoglycerol transferase I [Erwinia sp. OLMDSP33]
MQSGWLSLGLFASAVFLYASKAGHHKGWFSLILTLSGLYVLLNAILFACNYFTGEGINDAVLYTVTSSLSGAGIHKYLLPAGGLILGLVILFLLLAWLLRRRKPAGHSRLWSLAALLLIIASIETAPAYQQVSRLVQSQLSSGDSDFYSHYKQPAKRLRPGQRPNLIYIYAESLERTYFDDKAFANLTPELNAIKENSLDFSNTEQLPGTNYTIAGMVASQCGIPLFAPFDGNASSALSTFYPRNICLGDILKAAGYQNYFLQGASLRFARKDTFLSSHGFQHLYGFDELKPLVKDPDYRNDWGWYDDTLLELVYDKYVELSATDKPFALFALTVDTHHPDGFISRSCSRRSYDFAGKPNKSFAAVSCSQQHIAALIDKIKRTPGFKNTIIVVSSDHLAMNNTAYKYLNQHERRDLFFMLRGDRPDSKIIATKRSTLDNGATVLDAMGGDNFIGLGRSSLSATSLSVSYLNLAEKITQWKANVIQLWNLPKTLSDYQIDTGQNTLSVAGVDFRLPLLLAIKKDKIEPHFDVYLSDSLKKQLSRFPADEKFVWIDRCYKMSNVWNPQLATNTQYCLARGQLNASVEISPVSEGISRGRVTMPADSRPQATRYQQVQQQLRVADNDLKYPGDKILFWLPGMPDGVAHISGLSQTESWGRWSDANLQPDVRIGFQQPLPARFSLTMEARAFGENIHKPLTIRVGSVSKTVMLTDDVEQVTLTLDNPDAASEITLTPPAPTSTNEGFSDGSPSRKLGIGLVSLQVSPLPTPATAP